MPDSLLDLLDEDSRRDVMEVAWRRRFRRGDIVFHAGDPGDSLHVVMSGRVGVRITTMQGDNVTLAIVGVGDVFGELAVLEEEQPRSATAVAMEDLETLTLHRRDVEQLRMRHRSLDRFFIEVLAAHLRATSQQLIEALYLPAEPRVRRRVAELVDEYANGGGELEIPLTQSEIATLAGTSRATVNKVLREAEDKGLVELRRGRLLVPDPSKLAPRGPTRPGRR